VGITDHLKLITSQMPVAKLECIESNACAEQMRPEMKHVDFSGAVSEFEWFELHVLKLIQTIRFGDLGVEALAAELAVTSLNGTRVDDIVAVCDLPAIGTTDLLC